MTTPFTYLLLHRPTGKWYYGVKYAKDCNPSDLWTTYFSSSRLVHQLIEEYGKDTFDFQIRKTFLSGKDACDWEYKVLTRMNVRNDSTCLNQNVGGSAGYTHDLTVQHKKKISDSIKQYINDNPDQIKKRAKKIATNFWKNMSLEMREHISRKRKEQTNPMQGKRQKRVCCIECRKDLPVNLLSRHYKQHHDTT